MRYILILVLTALVLYGCGDKESSSPLTEKDKYSIDSSDIKLEKADNPSEQFTMEYRFAKGTPYNYRVTMISDVNHVTTADTTISMSVHNYRIYLLSLMPLAVDEEGNTELECRITSAKLEMEGGGQKVSYVSDTVKTKGDKEKFAEHHSLINNPFSLRLSKRGEILEVYKADKLVTTFLQYRDLQDSATAEDKANLKTQIIETMLKPILIQIFREVPSKVVAKDSVWLIKQPARQLLSFKVEQTNNFKVANLEKLEGKKLAVITGGLETVITGETKHSEQGVNYIFTRPNINASGTIYFNVDEGYVQKVKTQTNYDTFVTAEGPTPRGVQKMSKKEVIKNVNYVEKI